MYNFECINLRGSLMTYFIDRAAIAMAYHMYFLDIVARYCRCAGGGGGGGGCWRERERETGAAVGEFGETEVDLPAFTDKGHMVRGGWVVCFGVVEGNEDVGYSYTSG
ncbi:hypothetical protein OIU76_023001, partial [Salix suchowensis]